MAILWDSLHFYTNENQATIAEKISSHLEAMDYTRYDPFNALTGRVYGQGIKTFLSTPHDSWSRLIGTFPLDLSAQLSSDGLVVHLHLTDQDADVHVFVDEKPKPFSALIPHLREGMTVTDLHNAILRGDHPKKVIEDAMPMSALPDEIQKMARGLNPNQMNRMFNKMMGQVTRVMGDKTASARAMLAPTTPDWSNGLASNIRIFMGCLTIPKNWHTPDFITLRDAYMAQRRYSRNPNAPKLPSDTEAMSAVPDALAYLPIYGGK
ncbi:MAG: hypothetical protein SH821_04360 [Phototrophicales bacterium]|nr:hypothetical protein [Phototrophicales bacterium]